MIAYVLRYAAYEYIIIIEKSGMKEQYEMRYSLMTLPDGSEVTFSEERPDKTIKVFYERWNRERDDFDSMEMVLPNGKMEKIIGYSEEEAKKEEHYMENMAPLLKRFAKQGGVGQRACRRGDVFVIAGKFVVSDSGPLISMVKIGRLDLLNEMFGEVVVPRSVFDEIMSNKKFPGEREKIETSSFITVDDADDNAFVQSLMKKSGIQRGTAEAICLIKRKFKGQNVPLLVDGDACDVVKNEGINAVGTIDTLERALKEKRVTNEELSQYADILEITRRYSESELQQIRKLLKPQETVAPPDLDKIANKYMTANS